jgi:hypothetical protein
MSVANILVLPYGYPEPVVYGMLSCIQRRLRAITILLGALPRGN